MVAWLEQGHNATDAPSHKWDLIITYDMRENARDRIVNDPQFAELLKRGRQLDPGEALEAPCNLLRHNKIFPRYQFVSFSRCGSCFDSCFLFVSRCTPSKPKNELCKVLTICAASGVY